jgi:small subunit ribosomal protein S20
MRPTRCWGGPNFSNSFAMSVKPFDACRLRRLLGMLAFDGKKAYTEQVADRQVEACQYSYDSKGSTSVPNIKSQIKRDKQAARARLRNRAVRSELKTAVRRVQEAVAAGNVEAANEAVKVVYHKMDKAVAKGVIHKNQGSNRKSGVAKLVNKISA